MGWLLLVLFLINLFLAILIKSHRRFWISILVWSLLLVTVLFLKEVNHSIVEKHEKEYYTDMGSKSYGNHELWQKLKKQQTLIQLKNITMFRLLGFQTFLTFIVQIIGYRKTRNHNVFWWTGLAFGILTMLYFIFEFLMGVIPSGPII